MKDFQRKIYFILFVVLLNYQNTSVADVLENTTNLAACELMGLPILWSAPYNLNGDDIKIAVVDWGQIKPAHQEFQRDGASRIFIMGNENTTPHFHSTHLGGTIAASGVNPSAKGCAPQALLYSYLTTEYSYSRAILKAYEDAEITFSHHAYLYSDPIYSGVYEQEASDIDAVVSEKPFLNVFMAGGNDRGSEDYPNWGMMRGPTNAKNIFTVGLSIDDGNSIADYSNVGPVNDGRIKPDITGAAPGNGRLFSTSDESDFAYEHGGGTSSATARVAASSALILEQYTKETNSEHIPHDILKAALINSAVDKGREGPDYEYGFGNIDPLKAVKIIETINSEQPLIKTGSIKQDELIAYKINLENSEDLKITINWVDPAGDPNHQEKTLVNDIDIWLEKDGKNYYPFSLDKNNPSLPAAASGFNRVDNTEQIVIKNASSGTYMLFIKGFEIISHSQNFAIVSTHYLDTKDPGEQNNFPLPPSNFDALAINETTIKLKWKDNSDNESGFKIYRDDKLIHIANENSTTFTDTGLSLGITYTYTIKAYNSDGDSREVSTQVQTKKISSPVYSKVILENAESKNIDKWRIYDHIPWGYGNIKNIYDSDNGSHVIEVSNSYFINHTVNNENGIGYMLNKRFHHTKHKNIEWSIKTDKYFTVFAAVRTLLKNNIYITYQPSGYNKNRYNNKKGEYIWHDLGDITNGKWHTVKRDLQKDLESVYSNDKIISFEMFLVRGEARLDDIALFSNLSQNDASSDAVDLFINNCYTHILNRNSDQEGKTFWKEQLRDGKTATQVAKYFFQSNEFKNAGFNNDEFVEKAYVTLLNRESEIDGKKYWVDQIENRGKSRDLIVYEFAFSKEFSFLCDKYNISNYNIDDQLEAFIERMYVLVLERASDSQGLTAWQEYLKADQKSASDIVKSFFNSNEFLKKNIKNKKFIQIAYRAILSREADEEGLSYWQTLLSSKKITKEDLLDNFLHSDEFKTLIEKYQIAVN